MKAALALRPVRRGNNPQKVFHDKQQVVGIAWARFEIEMLVETFGVVIFGVNQHSSRANRGGSTR